MRSRQYDPDAVTTRRRFGVAPLPRIEAEYGQMAQAVDDHAAMVHGECADIAKVIQERGERLAAFIEDFSALCKHIGQQNRQTRLAVTGETKDEADE